MALSFQEKSQASLKTNLNKFYEENQSSFFSSEDIYFEIFGSDPP
jgi:hypothetical protein